jgi:hypothetical protein
MSRGMFEFREPQPFHLHRLDLILAELARPALDADTIGPPTRERLAGLGIAIGGTPRRQELIQRVWARKRGLMHSITAAGGWGLPGA